VVVECDARLILVPGGSTSELLVRFALEAGTFVRTDRLVEDVWAEDAVNTLRSKIARLRRAFGEIWQVIVWRMEALEADTRRRTDAS
jgi:DNA-binding response OmpR family regulator